MKKIFTTLCILFSITLTAQEASLQLNLKKGDKYHTKIVKKLDFSTVKDITNFETLTVKETTNKGFKIQLTIDRIVINVDKMGKPITYDSSIKEKDMIQEAKGLHSRVKPELNTVVSVDVNTNGKTFKTSKVSGQLAVSMVKQKTNFINLPETPVTIGSKWTQSLINGKVRVVYNYTVTKITPEIVYLNCIGEPLGKLKGTITGTIQLNRKTGVPIKKDMKFNLDLNGQIVKSNVVITIKKA